MPSALRESIPNLKPKLTSHTASKVGIRPVPTRPTLLSPPSLALHLRLARIPGKSVPSTRSSSCRVVECEGFRMTWAAMLIRLDKWLLVLGPCQLSRWTKRRDLHRWHYPHGHSHRSCLLSVLARPLCRSFRHGHRSRSVWPRSSGDGTLIHLLRHEERHRRSVLFGDGSSQDQRCTCHVLATLGHLWSVIYSLRSLPHTCHRYLHRLCSESYRRGECNHQEPAYILITCRTPELLLGDFNSARPFSRPYHWSLAYFSAPSRLVGS